MLSVLTALQGFGLEVKGDFFKKLTKVTFHDLRQFVKSQAYPVVRHPLLREIVGSNPFASVSASDLLFAVCRQLFMLLALFLIVQASAQNLHRLFFILVL